MAESEETDRFLRRMEPPAHDAIHPDQLRHPNDQDAARRELSNHKEQIRKLIREVLQENNLKSATNVEELAKLFPITGRTRGVDLKFQERKLDLNADQSIWQTDEDSEENEGGGADPGEDENGGKNRNGGKHRKIRNRQNPGPDPKPGTPRLRQPRIIRSGPRDLLMAFTTPNGENGEIRFSLRAAGEQYQKKEIPIPVQEVVEISDLTVLATAEDGEIVVQAPPNTRVNLMISLRQEDNRYQSYRLAPPRSAE